MWRYLIIYHYSDPKNNRSNNKNMVIKMAECDWCSFRATDICEVGHNLQQHCDGLGGGDNLPCQHQLKTSRVYGLHIKDETWGRMQKEATECKCHDHNSNSR